MREFLYVDDLAEACVHFARTYSDEAILNIGCGEDITIKEISEKVAQTVGYNGSIEWDASEA